MRFAKKRIYAEDLIDFALLPIIAEALRSRLLNLNMHAVNWQRIASQLVVLGSRITGTLV